MYICVYIYIHIYVYIYLYIYILYLYIYIYISHMISCIQYLISKFLQGGLHALGCFCTCCTCENTAIYGTGATCRSKWPLRPALGPDDQCAQKGCSILLRRRQCAQRGFSSVLFEIAVHKSWSRLHCALSHCTLHCFAPCMDMHGSTLVLYIYIYMVGPPS